METEPTTAATRLSLLQRAQSSPHHPSWAELIEFYQPFITRVLVRIGVNTSDLEDVRQQVLLRLWEGLPRYRRDEKGAKFRSWLCVLIRNAAVDWFRRRRGAKLENSLETTTPEVLPAQEPDVLTRMESEWEQYVIGLALEEVKKSFSGKAIEVLRLSFQGLSSEEIGERLAIRTESVYVLKTRVKTRLKKAITQIRKQLEEHEHAGD